MWYLLHFDYRPTPILRDEIIKILILKLKELEPYKFQKLNKDNIKKENYTKLIFEILLAKQPIAIKNAKKLLASYGDSHTPQQDNPSTTVHQLIQILNYINLSKN